ncbi:hypothetical protein cypCar_00031846 [Cyprinus carpio]|uniref:Uncharacterized protein LOC122138830 n=2 Tax=Cyprinus carpio TaxID=7962 RepID=A0A8C1LI77_CYPCA|nr:uncharacterized protein LOC122138830 [Cyprinus carpio]KTG04409.1 hypothetical protein cypCar_00031846 [Cyprinus carpio]
MSENQQLSHHRDDENGGESDILYTTRLREGRPNIDFTLSSEINKKLLKKETWIIKKSSKKPSVQPASAHVTLSNFIDIIDTADRPANAIAEGTYARSGTYAGKRIPKTGVYAEAGVGRACAEFSVFEAEAKGPNASASAEASVARLGAGAEARAEVGSASAQAGPFSMKVGLGLDTRVSLGIVDGLEVKVLGTGFTIGPRTSISLLGSEVSCSVI